MGAIDNIGLHDENIYPDDHVLEEILGRSYTAYRALLALFDENDLEYTWRYYKDGKAWLCKVQEKGRTIVWMSAWKGYIKATIYFPHKYIEGLYALGLSETIKEKIRQTENTGTSKPCVFEMRGAEALDDFKTIMHYKIISK